MSMKLEWTIENMDELWPGARRLVLEDVADSDPEERGWFDGVAGDASLVVMPRSGLTVLSSLYVPLRWRGRGIGRSLVRKALNELCPVLTPVYLMALPFWSQPRTEERLRAWYEEMGFLSVQGHEFLMWLPGPEMSALFDTVDLSDLSDPSDGFLANKELT